MAGPVKMGKKKIIIRIAVMEAVAENVFVGQLESSGLYWTATWS